MFKDTNTSVAGAPVLVVSILINRLLSSGARVRATVHREEPVITDERIEYVSYDLTNMEDLPEGGQCHGLHLYLRCQYLRRGGDGNYATGASYP